MYGQELSRIRVEFAGNDGKCCRMSARIRRSAAHASTQNAASELITRKPQAATPVRSAASRNGADLGATSLVASHPRTPTTTSATPSAAAIADRLEMPV